MAPTFVTDYEATWSSTASPQTSSVTTAIGDVLVAFATCFTTETISTPTGGTSLTWALQRSIVNVASRNTLYAWTATATTAETFTFSLARAGGTKEWGFTVERWSASTGIGATAIINAASSAPSLAITTQADHSAVVVFDADWNAADGASRVWRTGAGTFTEETYNFLSTKYTVYGGFHADGGLAGAKTVGLTTPNQTYSIAAVEVLPAAPAIAPQSLIVNKALRRSTCY